MKQPVIAIVEDNTSLRLAIDNLVRSLDFDTLLFASAESFLASVAALAADCVLTDIQMGVLSGLDLLDRLQARTQRPPVIVITAVPVADARPLALRAGAFACLHKPFEDTELASAIHEALASRNRSAPPPANGGGDT